MSSSSSVASRSSRTYDLVLFGASGFTGGLAASYLASVSEFHALSWALAGRSKEKLVTVQQRVLNEHPAAKEPAIIIADIADHASVQRMAQQTRVVITTVGPYQLYGEPLLAACAQNGTDYCDLTGEVTWMHAMQKKYESAARSSGAILVNFCGFDSVPADLTSYLAASELQRRGTPTRWLYAYVHTRGMGVSGGTVASMMAMASASEEEQRQRKDTHLLNHPDFKLDTVAPEEHDMWKPQYSSIIGRWTIPFIMSQINTRVVRRSLSLRRWLDDPKHVGFGSRTTYNESMVTTSIFNAALMYAGIVLMTLIMLLKPLHGVVKHLVPQGSGPSAESRAKASFSYRCVGEGEDGRRVQATMRGGDGGYTDTAKMISEIGLMLAFEREELEVNKKYGKKLKTGNATHVGGFLTPSVIDGQRLTERLRKAGLDITVGEFK